MARQIVNPCFYLLLLMWFEHKCTDWGGSYKKVLQIKIMLGKNYFISFINSTIINYVKKINHIF